MKMMVMLVWKFAVIHLTVSEMDLEIYPMGATTTLPITRGLAQNMRTRLPPLLMERLRAQSMLIKRNPSNQRKGSHPRHLPYPHPVAASRRGALNLKLSFPARR